MVFVKNRIEFRRGEKGADAFDVRQALAQGGQPFFVRGGQVSAGDKGQMLGVAAAGPSYYRVRHQRENSRTPLGSAQGGLQRWGGRRE